MPAKPNAKTWTDVQMAIAAISVAATLGFWNLFSTPVSSAVPVVSTLPSAEPPTPAAAAPTVELPAGVKIYFGGSAPQTVRYVNVPQAPAPQTNKSKPSSQPAPQQPVTQTKTS